MPSQEPQHLGPRLETPAVFQTEQEGYWSLAGREWVRPAGGREIVGMESGGLLQDFGFTQRSNMLWLTLKGHSGCQKSLWEDKGRGTMIGQEGYGSISGQRWWWLGSARSSRDGRSPQSQISFEGKANGFPKALNVGLEKTSCQEWSQGLWPKNLKGRSCPQLTDVRQKEEKIPGRRENWGAALLLTSCVALTKLLSPFVPQFPNL